MSGAATTRWSLILAARGTSASAQEALSQLCQDYRPVVLAYFRRQEQPQLADDRTQAFFLHFLDRHLHDRVDAARGSFRAFLFTSVRNHWHEALRNESARKRLAGPEAGEAALTDVADAQSSPEHLFDRDWALHVLRRARDKLEQEAHRSGKSTLFAAVQDFLIEPPEASDYVRIGAALGMPANNRRGGGAAHARTLACPGAPRTGRYLAACGGHRNRIAVAQAGVAAGLKEDCLSSLPTIRLREDKRPARNLMPDRISDPPPQSVASRRPRRPQDDLAERSALLAATIERWLYDAGWAQTDALTQARTQEKSVSRWLAETLPDSLFRQLPELAARLGKQLPQSDGLSAAAFVSAFAQCLIARAVDEVGDGSASRRSCEHLRWIATVPAQRADRADPGRSWRDAGTVPGRARNRIVATAPTPARTDRSRVGAVGIEP